MKQRSFTPSLIAGATLALTAGFSPQLTPLMK
jgi:hypothetical protein